MDLTQIIVLCVAGVAVIAAASFFVGLHIGANVAGKHLVSAIIEQGFVNVGGVRYRVDQIGRKAK